MNINLARRLKIIGYLLLSMFGVSVFGLYLSAEAGPASVTLTSPENTFRVDLIEHVDTVNHWAFNPLRIDPRQFNDVWFSAYEGDSLLASHERLWDDSSGNYSRFFESFKYEWVSNSVLRFRRDKSNNSQQDEVTVSNHSSQSVATLRLESGDIFLVFDLQPNRSVKVLANPQSWLSWVSCYGKFASGRSIPFRGVNFPLQDGTASDIARRYCVAVTEEGLIIQKRDSEGFWDEKGNNVTVAKGTCDVPTKSATMPSTKISKEESDPDLTSASFRAHEDPQSKKPGVLLPETEADHAKHLCSRPAPPDFQGTWKPTQTEIEAMETRMSQISRLRTHSGIAGVQIDHPEHYYRQYLGIIIKNRKSIFINAFCDDKPQESWRDMLYDVCDGGCSWGVIYDVETQKFSHLEMNGVA